MESWADFLNATDEEKYGPDTGLCRKLINLWISEQKYSSELNLTALRLHTLVPLPDYVVNLAIGNLHLIHIPGLPPGLKRFTCSNAINLSKIPELAKPLQLKYVNFTRTQITRLPELGPYIQEIRASHTQISEIPHLYSGIMWLSITNTPVKSLGCKELPETMTTLDIDNTLITDLPKLNSGLKFLSMNNTGISVIPEMPISLREISVKNCPNLYIQRRLYWKTVEEDISEYGYRWSVWRKMDRERRLREQFMRQIKMELIKAVWDPRFMGRLWTNEEG